MNLLVQLLTLLVLVVGVGASIALAGRWTRQFADLLWYFVLAPRTVSLAVLLSVIAIGASTRAVLEIALVGPLAFAIQLILVPLVAVPLSDLLAYLADAAKSSDAKNMGWKGYLFASRRRAQREAYAAPRNEP